MGIDENRYFREAVLRICSSLDIEQALMRCFEYFKDIFPVEELGFHIYDRQTRIISTVARASAQADALHATPQHAMLPEEVLAPLRGNVLPEVRLVNDMESDPITREVNKSFGKTEPSSALIMRLVISGERIGALTLRSKGTGQYTEEHARLLSLLNEPFGIVLSNSLRYQEVLRLKDLLSDDNRYLHRELLKLSGEEIIGDEFGLRGVMEMVQRVAPLNSPVLLLGETGVGKELIANAIHYSSGRRNGAFIKVNCGAIPETLIDSELFGHEKGAFTGAIAQKRGRFERAHNGTIFLDEVGDLPLGAQTRLLRVLQDKEIERVGGSGPIKVDTRIIAATNRDLKAMARSGVFRDDLWFRLNVFPISIPPLRDRRQDIPALVYYFVERKSKEMSIKEIPRVTPEAMENLISYDWPGNVRELENAVERELILEKGSRVLTFDGFEPTLSRDIGSDNEMGKPQFLKFDDNAAQLIRRALALCGGKVQGKGGAAELLGLNPNTLRNRMNKLAIPYGKRRNNKPEKQA